MYNIAPSHDVPIIIKTNRDRQIVLMKWGLSLPFKIKSGIHPFNVRSEGIEFHPLFRDAFTRYRCLVPATGFYEWKREGRKKIPFLIKRSDDQFIAFAGIYYPDLSSSHYSGTFAIITTNPNKLVARVHNRMPVILKKETENTWISGDDWKKLSPFLSPFPEETLVMYQVSDEVNNPLNDREDLIQPLKPFFT